MSKLLQDDTILLRALEPEDLDILYEWENDTDLWKYGSSLSPFSRFALRQYLVYAQQDIYQTKQLRLMIVLRETTNESEQSICTILIHFMAEQVLESYSTQNIEIKDMDPNHLNCWKNMLLIFSNYINYMLLFPNRTSPAFDFSKGWISAHRNT